MWVENTPELKQRKAWINTQSVSYNYYISLAKLDPDKHLALVLLFFCTVNMN